MRKPLHLFTRIGIQYWRRAMPAGCGAAARRTCLTLSLATREPALARRLGAALDVAFEILMASRDDTTLPPGALAALMRTARDMLLDDMAAERAQAGPDPMRPRTPRGASGKLDEAGEAALARFLTGEPEPGTEVPPALAAVLRCALPLVTQPVAGLPSRTAAATDRAMALQGRIRFLRGEMLANDHSAAHSKLDRALNETGLRAGGTARFPASGAVLEGMIAAYAQECDRLLGRPVLAETAVLPVTPIDAQPAAPIGASAEPPRVVPPPGPVQSIVPKPAPLMPPVAEPRPLAPTDAPIASPALPEGVGPRRLFSVAYAQFAAEKAVAKAWSPETEHDAGIARRLFIDLCGDRPVGDYTRDDALHFRRELAKICSDWGQNRLYRNPADPARRVSAIEVVRISEDRPPGVTRLSPKSVNKQVSFLNDFWNFVVLDQRCRDLERPFAGMQKKPKGKQRRSADSAARDAFTIAEVRRIFASQEWCGLRPLTEDGKALRPGGEAACYFAPLLGAYAGMRLGEICQLRRGDVKQHGTIWCIEVYPTTPDKEEPEGAEAGKKVKSVAADRIVPLHPVLERMGLIQYLQALGGRPDDRLFPELKATGRGGYSRDVSRWFTDFRRRLKLTRGKLMFHSLRHTVRTMLDSLVDERMVDLLLGHEGPSEGSGQRYNKGYWARPRLEAISLLSYGITEFGEDGEVVRRMTEDGFVLAAGL